MKHKCEFDLLASNATAVYEKQEGQDNEFLCKGNVYQCRACEKRIVAPYDNNLRIVEVE